MSSWFVDSVGAIGAALTTLCWLPQATKILRERDTSAISLPAQLAFTLGVVMWLIYGIAINDWPLIASSAVTAALTGMITALKLRHG